MVDLSKDISWQNIFGAQPDTQNSQPKVGLAEASGDYADGQIVLRTLPGRADLVYQPSPSDMLSGPFQSLGNASEATERFISQANALMQKLRLVPDIQVSRLAFGAILRMPMPDKQSSYITLNEFLHSVDVDETSSDFQYSINRRRKSKIVTDMEINRLSIWSSIGYHQFNIEQGMQGMQGVEIPSAFACQLVLDINTVPSDKFFPLNDLEAGYGELLALGKEIAEYGDIP